MPEPSAWRNTSVRRATGTRPESMMSRSTCPGPTDGSWSTSPTRTSVGAGAHGGHEAARQLHVEHRGLVDDEEIGRQRIVVAAPKRPATAAPSPSLRGLPHSSRRCTVCALRPVASASRLAARPVGAASITRRLALLPGLHERAHHRRLAGAGTAGDDDDAGLAAAGDRAPLSVRQLLGADDRGRLVALGVDERRGCVAPARARRDAAAADRPRRPR